MRIDESGFCLDENHIRTDEKPHESRSAATYAAALRCELFEMHPGSAVMLGSYARARVSGVSLATPAAALHSPPTINCSLVSRHLPVQVPTVSPCRLPAQPGVAPQGVVVATGVLLRCLYSDMVTWK